LALFRAAADRPLRHILISSPGAGEDHAAVAANFSMELARAGYYVILVDANLHRPAQQRLFRLKNHVGLTTLLQDTQLESDGVLQPTATPGLLVLTSGPLPRNSVQLLSSKRMQSVLATLQEKADIVVIDTSPITATADASVLAAQVDCVLPVITAGHTKGELAKQAVAILHQIGTNVLGVVLTGLRPGQITYRAGAAYRVAAIHTPGPRVAKGQGLFHLNSARKPQPSQSVNGASDGETQDSPNPHR
jgi:capsular exopolysaccharide synthesis family protein